MSTTRAQGSGASIDATPTKDTTTATPSKDTTKDTTTPTKDAPPPPPPNHENISEFDPASLALSQDFQSNFAVKRLITTIPVRKPNKHEFVRVHPSPKMQLLTAALMLKGERDEVFIVEKQLWSSLATELQPIALFATINRQNVVTLWPVKLPKADGRQDTWGASALDAAERAKTGWVRVVANMSLGAYEVFAAMGDLPEPEWPDVSFAKILEIAFRDRYVQSNDHPALKKLRGEL